MNSQIMFKERGIELKSLKLSDNEFNRMKGIVFDSTGISLGDSKRALLVSRLSRRLRQLNMSSFQLYIHRLQNDTGEILRMVNYVTTNLTRFNREKVQFQVLKNIVLPEIMKTGKKEKKEEKKKKLRIWSAGCSSGEEVYTILFEIMEFFGGTIPSFLDFKILGSDIDTNVLNKAKSGIYTRKEMKGLGRDVIERCFEPIFTDDSRSSDKEFVVKEKLRKYVLFSKINLVYDEFKFRNQLDIVFCRNVVIYFENEAKKKLYSKIYSLLNEPGFFFSGHSENLFKYPEMFEFLGKSVYKKVVFS